MNRARSPLAALLVSALVMTGLSGCGEDDEVTYAPAAYGEVIGGIGRCYYVTDPAEIGYLYAANLCPHTWIAYPMPLYWHQRYFTYYSSPAYYTRFVPVGSRTVYISSQRTFYTTYRVQVSAQTRYASYRGSDGRNYSGSKVDAAKFRSGTPSGSGQQNGAGSARGGSGGGSSGRIGGSGSSGSGSGSRGYSGGGSVRGGK